MPFMQIADIEYIGKITNINQRFNNLKNTYVYVYCDENNIPFYVGKGKGDRYISHITRKNVKNNNIMKKNKINSILRKGYHPIIYIIQDNLSDKESLSLEDYIIKFYGRKNLDKNGILTNRMCCGKNGRNFLPQSSRDSISLAMKNRIISDETRLKMSNSKIGRIPHNKGKETSKEIRIKISKSKKGTNYSEEGRKNIKTGQINRRISERKNKEYFFRHISGQLYKTNEMKSFCKKHDINYKNLSNIYILEKTHILKNL